MRVRNREETSVTVSEPFLEKMNGGNGNGESYNTYSYSQQPQQGLGQSSDIINVDESIFYEYNNDSLDTLKEGGREKQKKLKSIKYKKLNRKITRRYNRKSNKKYNTKKRNVRNKRRNSKRNK